MDVDEPTSPRLRRAGLLCAGCHTDGSFLSSLQLQNLQLTRGFMPMGVSISKLGMGILQGRLVVMTGSVAHVLLYNNPGIAYCLQILYHILHKYMPGNSRKFVVLSAPCAYRP